MASGYGDRASMADDAGQLGAISAYPRAKAIMKVLRVQKLLFVRIRLQEDPQNYLRVFLLNETAIFSLLFDT